MACADLRAKEEDMRFGLDIFEQEPADYTELTLVEKENQMLANIWMVKEDWDNEWNQWKNITFYELAVEEMDDLAVDFINKIRDMPKEVRQWGIYEFMKNKLELFRNTMPLITDLRDESMRQRHWNDVRFEVKEEFNETSDEFTLEKVFELELNKHADMISELAHNAKK